MPRNPAVLLTALIALFAAPHIIEATETKASVAGTYVLERSPYAGCELKVSQTGDDTISFELSCNRGAPTYNSGLAVGTIPLINNTAIHTRSVSGFCEIQFSFHDNEVVVSQKGSDVECGFGWGVYCDGTYILRDPFPPKTQLLRE